MGKRSEIILRSQSNIKYILELIVVCVLNVTMSPTQKVT